MNKKQLGSSVLLLMLLAVLGVPMYPQRSHALGTGSICIAQPGDANCPTAPVTFTGPVTSPVPTQVRVAVLIQNSDPFLGFDITLSTDPSVLQPASVDLTGTILLGAITILANCVQGVAVQGICGPGAANNITSLEVAAVGGGGLTVSPATGLLFTAIYNIVGSTAPGGTTINYAQSNVCSPSSSGTYCVGVSNGTITPVSENLQTAGFDNSSPAEYATWMIPTPSSLTTLAPTSGTGSHTASASLTPKNGFGNDCQSPPSSTDLCTVTFVTSVMGPAGLTVSAPLPTSLSGIGDGVDHNVTFTINVASSISPGTYSISVTAIYQVQTPAGTGPTSTLAQTITIPVSIQDFTLTASPTTVPFWIGKTGTTMVSVSPVNGFNATVSISNLAPTPVSPTPTSPALAVSESPASIPNGSGASTVSFSGGSLGAYTVSVRASATVGGQSKTKSVTITVRVQDFNITSGTSSLTFDSGTTKTAVITIGSMPSGALSSSGFAGTVALSATVNATGLSVSFSNNAPSLAAGSMVLSTVSFSAAVSSTTVFGVVVHGTATLPSSGVEVNDVAFTVTVSPSGRGFSISADPTTVSVLVGTAGNSTVTVTSIIGFTGTISLSATASPSTGINCAIFPASITLGTSGTAKLSCGGISPGTYVVTVTGTNGTANGTLSTVVTYSIQDFDITANPSTVSIAGVGGATGTSTITVAPLGGFTGTVSLTKSVSPSGLNCNLNPIVVSLANTPGVSTLSCQGTAGTYTVAITGTTAALSHLATVTFNVGAIICLGNTTTTNSTSCPATPTSLTAVPGTQLKIPIIVQNSPALLGFDITLTTNATILQPADANLTGTILPGTRVVLGKCIGGIAVQGGCSSSAAGRANTLEFAVVGSLTGQPVNGLLFTAVFDVLGQGAATIEFQTGCSLSSHSPLCIDLSDGTTTPVPVQYVMTASFAGQGATKFTMLLNPGSVTTVPPGLATSTLTLTAIAPFTGTVTLSVSAPMGLTATISPTSVQLLTSANASLSVNVPSNMAPGTYNVIVTGSGGDETNAAVFRITIPALDFTISASPSSLAIFQGSRANATITLTNLTNLSGIVSLTATSSALSAIISPPLVQLNPNGVSSSILQIFTQNVGPGTYFVTVTGTSGTISHSLVLTVIVQPTPVLDFTISATPSSLTVVQGSATNSTIILSNLTNLSGYVSLTATSSSSLFETLSPPLVQLNPNGTATSILQIFASNIGTGTFFVTVIGTSGTISHSVSVIVTVLSSPPDFGLSTFPFQSSTIFAGGNMLIEVDLFSQGSSQFTGSVTITAQISPTRANGPSVNVNPAMTFVPGFSTATVLTTSLTPPGNYTLTITGTSGSLVHSVQLSFTVLPPPTITATPSSGPIGSLVVVQGRGFPVSGPFSSTVEIEMTYDDQLVGLFFPQNSSFSFTFDVPLSQPGLHHIHAVIPFGPSLDIQTGFTVLATPSPLNVSVSVGNIYFPGETAVFFVQTSLNGQPTTVSSLRLVLVLPNGSNVTLTAAPITTGVWKASYAVPTKSSIGTYAITVTAHQQGSLDGLGLASFEVKPTWLQSHAPAVSGGLAIAAVLGVVMVAWQKGLLPRRKDEDPVPWT